MIHNPYNEDRATLIGRKYEHFRTHFGGTATRLIQDLFINGPHWPASNKKPLGEYATYFAGERYRALPVDTGDVIRIVSRTILWREGVNKALEDGILLKITASTEPPVYTSTVTASACYQYTWSVNNQTYTVSGNYTESFVTPAGCDSTQTLILTINGTTYSTENVVAAKYIELYCKFLGIKA